MRILCKHAFSALAGNTLFVHAAVLLFVPPVRAGDLDPPPGPPGVTMKTLDEVEARTPVQSLSDDADGLYIIDQSGSYYLTGNITGVSGKSGILLAADDVTLDLNGFALIGVAGSNWGITNWVDIKNVTIRNGTIRDWPKDAVFLSTGTDNGALEDIRVSGCGQLGLSVATSSSRLTRCDITQCADQGIRVLAGTVVNCTVTDCYTGIHAEGSAISNCTVHSCLGDGLIVGESSIVNTVAIFNASVGIVAENGSTVRDCSATHNGVAGIVAEQSTITDCAARDNAGPGFYLTTSKAVGCTAAENWGTGFEAYWSTISNCMAASDFLGSGFSVYYGSILNSVATDNASNGIEVADGSAINCTVLKNTTDGIHAGGKSLVLGNTCSSNGYLAGDGAGIYADGTSRIEGNTCTDNDRGIDCPSGSNLIIKNTLSGNATGPVIVGTNAWGPVIDVAAAGPIGSIPGSDHPWANFEF